MATMYNLAKETASATTVVTGVKYNLSLSWNPATGVQYYITDGQITNPATNAVYVLEVTDSTNTIYVYVNTAVSSNYAFATTFIPTTINVYQQL